MQTRCCWGLVSTTAHLSDKNGDIIISLFICHLYNIYPSLCFFCMHKRTTRLIFYSFLSVFRHKPWYLPLYILADKMHIFGSDKEREEGDCFVLPEGQKQTQISSIKCKLTGRDLKKLPLGPRYHLVTPEETELNETLVLVSYAELKVFHCLQIMFGV